jgi:hypothetical protein
MFCIELSHLDESDKKKMNGPCSTHVKETRNAIQHPVGG